MSLTLSLFGAFHATHTTHATHSEQAHPAPIPFATNAARALLAYLAVESNRPHPREVLATLFWPDVPQATASTNLRQTLARLRKALSNTGDAILHITVQSVQLNDAAAHIDVVQFEELLAECAVHSHSELAHCPDCVARLHRAVRLYRGEFLQGLTLQLSQPFEEWLLFKREELHRQMLAALHTLTQHTEANGKFEEACRHALRQLALEPWREEAHRQLMRLLTLQEVAPPR